MPRSLIDEADTWAAQNDTTRSDAIRRLIEVGLKGKYPTNASAQSRVIAPAFAPRISADDAFALMLETACEDFDIMLALIKKQIVFSGPKSEETAAQNFHDHAIAVREARSGPRIQMALAKSFVFYARRANRICTNNQGSLSLARLERIRFLKATNPLTPVRDVIEHGFDHNSSSKPSMHTHQDAILDETALVIDSPQRILMGPLNLNQIYLAVQRARLLAGLNALNSSRTLKDLALKKEQK